VKKLTVQGCSTVGHGSSPLTDKGPLVGTRVGSNVVADVLSVLPRQHSDKLVGEDLVLVVVDSDIHVVVVRYRQEAIVAAWVLETVLDDDNAGLRVLALLVVAVVLESPDIVIVELRDQRLVDKLDTGNDIVVGRVAILALNLVEDGESQSGTRVD